jgi:hypothetical protein
VSVCVCVRKRDSEKEIKLTDYGCVHGLGYVSEPGIQAGERRRTAKGRTRNLNLAPRGVRFIGLITSVYISGDLDRLVLYD